MKESTQSGLEALFLALGDKTRLKLLEIMAAGPVAVGLLVDHLNESQPKVSRHLAYLRNVGIVATRRDGKRIYYGIKYPEDPMIRDVLDTVLRSISAARAERNVKHFVENGDVVETSGEPKHHIHANAYVDNDDERALEYEVADYFGDDSQKDELDVFLL
jgi:DNA-binding transcriptional ArsR family regulator